MNHLRVAVIPVTPFQQNCSLVFDEISKRGAVVDPGGDLDRIENSIRQADITVEKILLTHGHVDHASGADELREKLKVKIEGPHVADKFFLDELETRGIQYGMAGGRNVVPDRWLGDGDTVEVAGFKFSVIHAPGHSPGSVVFFNSDNKFALMGDVLFQGSIGRTDLRLSDHGALIHAIKTKILPLGDDIDFLPGHGGPSRLGVERMTNPFLV